MFISHLRMVNIRLFESLELDLVPGFNVFIGSNGAGKTTILEAIDVLSRGKSFRSSNLNEIVKQNESDLAISCRVLSAEKNETTLSIIRKKSSTALKVNDLLASKWSEITQFLPIISIHPESYQVITGGPNERRKFLDWGLFHVEPGFRKNWSSYMRALKQRNACLRNRQINDAKQWHSVLDEYGCYLHQARTSYIEAIMPLIMSYANNLNLNKPIQIGYRQGWTQEDNLAYCLDRELQNDELPQSTSVGPHRADLSIKWNNKKFSSSSSRGQQKVLAIAMYLAQSQYMANNFSKKSIYLVDELPAELDQETCYKVLTLLSELNSQVVITSVSDHYLSYHIPADTKWFHVEHGRTCSTNPVL